MGCAISPSGFPQIFSVKNRFFSMRHRLTGVHEPHKRFAPNGRQPFSLHRLSGALELPLAGSPYPGGSFFQHRLTGARELRQRVRPIRAAPFLHRLSGVRELPQAGSPLTGGKFFAELQRGDSPSADGGNVAAPAAGGKKEGTPAVSLPLWTPTFPLLPNLAQIADM